MTTKTTAYTALVHTAELDPAEYVVSVRVMRRDGEPMTAKNMEAASKAFPRAETYENLPGGKAEKTPASTAAKAKPKASRKRAA